MSERELFQIGQVAKLYHLSVGTLRHYEKMGLLRPEYTDPATGYRYYSIRQFEELTNIRYLRALGMPLEEIAAYLQNRDVDTIAAALRRQKALIARKKQEFEVIERKIDHRLAQLEEAQQAELDVIRLVEQPARRVVWLRAEVKFNSYLWLEGSIRELERDQAVPLSYIGKVGVGVSREHLLMGKYDRYDLVFLLLDEEDIYDGRVEQLPEEKCVSVHFRGSHDRAAGYYGRLMDYLKANGLRAAGSSQEMTLIDDCISNDPATYVTEICIPVESAEQTRRAQGLILRRNVVQ